MLRLPHGADVSPPPSALCMSTTSPLLRSQDTVLKLHCNIILNRPWHSGSRPSSSTMVPATQRWGEPESSVWTRSTVPGLRRGVHGRLGRRAPTIDGLSRAYEFAKLTTQLRRQLGALVCVSNRDRDTPGGHQLGPETDAALSGLSLGRCRGPGLLHRRRGHRAQPVG